MARIKQEGQQVLQPGQPKGERLVNGSAQALAAQERDDQTDRTRWRLKDDHGRHIWHYIEKDAEHWPQTVADKYFLGLATVREFLRSPNPAYA